jgi:hypothetical protein
MNTIMKAKAIILGSLVAVLAACGTPSLETLISQYEKAVEEGDVAKAEALIVKIGKQSSKSDLTYEQAERITNASMQLLHDNSFGLMDAVSEEALDAFGSAYEEAAAAMGTALEEAALMLEDAYEEAAYGEAAAELESALEEAASAIDYSADEWDDALEEAAEDLEDALEDLEW